VTESASQPKTRPKAAFDGWDVGIRTPITASRARCPTVERRPSKALGRAAGNQDYTCPFADRASEPISSGSRRFDGQRLPRLGAGLNRALWAGPGDATPTSVRALTGNRRDCQQQRDSCDHQLQLRHRVLLPAGTSRRHPIWRSGQQNHDTSHSQPTRVFLDEPCQRPLRRHSQSIRGHCSARCPAAS
jgi:hypothetical protein